MSEESRIERKKKEKKKGGDDGEESEFWSYVAVVGILGIIVLVSYFLFFSGGAAAEVEPWDDVQAWDSQDPTMVAADATEDDVEEMVEVTYYADFACPACASFEANSFPDLKDDYVATGDVKLTVKPVDFLAAQDDNSRTGALGARAVWEQNRSAYWTWHRVMFANFGDGANWASASNVGEYANQVGIDGDAVEQSVEQGDHVADVQRSANEARDAGVTGTPGFVVNDTSFTGDNYQRLTDEIESELD